MEFLQEELDEILNIFQQESGEILQSMDKNLLILEKKPKNTEIAMQLFRDAHSLKGSARMLGFNGIQNIAHKIEDILGLVKDEKLVPDSYITDTISSALSFISGLIEKTFEQKNEYVTDEVDIYIDRLVKIAEGNSEDVVSVQSPEKEIEAFAILNPAFITIPIEIENVKKYIEKISYKTLSATLKELEADKLVHREEYPQIPPKVEYSLTERGKSLIPILNAICDWGEENAL